MLDKMYLELHLRLVDFETETTPRDGDDVGVVNNLVNSLFVSLDIKVAHQVVGTSTLTPYAYRAYFSGKKN